MGFVKRLRGLIGWIGWFNGLDGLSALEMRERRLINQITAREEDGRTENVS